MVKKILSAILAAAFMMAGAGGAFAKAKGDWEAVKGYNHREIAIQRSDGETLFGRIKEIDDSGLTMLTANQKQYLENEVKIPRNDVKKVWRAKLRYNERRIGTGALIGAGAGAAAGIIEVKNRKEPSGTVVIAIPLYAAIGGGIGAAIGYFSKKKNKKKQLIYSA